jgi:hypothetical protein
MKSVHCFGKFTNVSDHPLLLNFRDVHGIRSGHLRFVGEGVVFQLPPAPRRFSGLQGLVLLQPKEVFESQFFLVSPFYKPLTSGTYILSLGHAQPAYREADIVESKEFL